MQLDELKQAFRAMDSRLERQNEMNDQVYKEQKLDRVRASLRPIVWGHAGQAALGLLLTLLVSPFWWKHLDSRNLMIAGVIMHVYAVLMIVLGARVLVLLYRLDFAAPVIVIQKQLAELRRSYLNCGLVIGLPWWLLWIPFVMVMSGLDLYASATRGWILATIAFGAVGMLITVWFYRWYQPSDPEQVRRLEDAKAGRSMQSVQRFLGEIAEFERE